MRYRLSSITVVLAMLAMSAGLTSGATGKEVIEPGPFLGEYEGTFTPTGGAAVKAQAKIFGQPGGVYKVVLIVPSEKEGEIGAVFNLSGKVDGDKLAVSGKSEGMEFTGIVEKQQFLAEAKGEKGGKIELKFTVRKSPTEGKKPPKDALVLLAFEEGKAPSMDAWDNKTWVADANEACIYKGKGDIRTTRKFADVQLHVEFMCPYMPESTGQARGNSGVYLQDRYEVQVLDSFGLVPQKNDCGALYNVAAPKSLAALPPLRWQTYDVTFVAPKLENGKVVKKGTITVMHNGILVHDKQELPTQPANPAGARGVVDVGVLKLQDHGNTVKFRNVWLVETGSGTADK